MEIDLRRFREAFFQEVEEHLAHMETDLLRLEQGDRDTELLDSVFRSAHSIKGASGTFGFEDLARFTHALETLLDQMRGGAVDPAEVSGLLLQSLDLMKELLEAARTDAQPPARAVDLASQLMSATQQNYKGERLGERQKEQLSTESSIWQIKFIPSMQIFEQGMDPVLILRELAECGELLELKADVSRIPALAEMDPELCYLGWELRLKSNKTEAELQDVFAFVEESAEISIKSDRKQEHANASMAMPALSANHGPKVSREPSSVRVATEKVDKLIDLVGELVIAQSMAAEILQHFSPAKLTSLKEAFAELERNTRELQERVMGIRMIPVGAIFSRFPRLVRDLSTLTQKKIALELSGEDTELDKSVVESLSDPLTHIIRNSADHGLEMPEERTRLGKPDQGTIQLHTYHQGGNVIVEVKDDGRGLNAEKIRAKAIERRMITPDAQLTTEETYNLIFAPGFSTADKVTDLSGRGVGMDVVRRNIQALNGDVSVTSSTGAGTTVRIKLPLTLAILEGLLLRVGKQTFVLPLISILESIRPAKSQLNSMAGTNEVIVVRGEAMSIIRLHKIFGIPTEIKDPTKGLVVLVESQGRRVALLVDELLGQQQVVVKSLETNFRKVDGIIGATILGDGHAALIIDVAQLTQMESSAVVAA